MSALPVTLGDDTAFADDGQRFVVFRPSEASSERSNAITVVTKWQAGLR